MVLKPPVLKPREVTRILESLGFKEVRQRGSHRQYRHQDGRVTPVPYHPGRDIFPILLRQVARDIGLTVDEFLMHPCLIARPDPYVRDPYVRPLCPYATLFDIREALAKDLQ